MLTTLTLLAMSAFPQAAHPLEAVPFERVEIRDPFWLARIDTNRRATIEANLAQCEATGRLENFAVAAGLVEGEHEGLLYNDSDVYKVLEGIAYTLAVHPDEELEARADRIIDWIAAAQEEDGYLNTYVQLVAPEKRWANIAHGHELYCAGHLIEAAVAYERATGKRKLLDVAIRFADRIDEDFGPDARQDPPGHEELELALYKLAARTGEERYRRLARFFLLQRGNRPEERLFGRYAQDHLPVLEQREVTGHAVRAMYLYSAMADEARLSGEARWLETLRALWRDVTRRKMYVTGGIGNSASNEGFTEPFELPNESAYCETCASIGMALWAQRMLLLTREPEYADVLERELYNNVLAGVSVSGDRFFYDNPLASDGTHHRVPWFDCSCCPTNLVRFLPAIGERVIAHDEDEVYVHQYVGCATTVDLAAGPVRIAVSGEYPFGGRERIEVAPERRARFTLHLRVPDWVDGEASARVGDEVRRVPHRADTAGVWLSLERKWSPGEVVTLELPMRPRRLHADPRVAADRGRVALAYGPTVYAFEGVDHGGAVCDLVLPEEAELRLDRSAWELGAVPRIRARGLRLVAEGEERRFEEAELVAIPYALWDHRAPGPMAVWLAEDPALAHLPGETGAVRLPGVTLRASHCYRHDTLAALLDEHHAERSDDHSIPRMTFWDHRGTSEWIELAFDEPRTLSGVAVLWFDDTGRGSCRVPAAWRLEVFADGAWTPIEPTAGAYGVERDAPQRVAFAPRSSTRWRLTVDLQPGWSAGILDLALEDAAER